MEEKDNYKVINLKKIQYCYCNIGKIKLFSEPKIIWNLNASILFSLTIMKKEILDKSKNEGLLKLQSFFMIGGDHGIKKRDNNLTA